jgi:hypothetical protein
MNFFNITFLFASRTSKGQISVGLQLKIFDVFIRSVSIALFPSLMSIVARGGVMCEFYMEQSSIDFGYIFPLITKHSPQVSSLNLCSFYSKHNYA